MQNSDDPIPEFFMHLSRAMSVASMQRAKCLQPKTKDEASAKMWGVLPGGMPYYVVE